MIIHLNHSALISKDKSIPIIVNRSSIRIGIYVKNTTARAPSAAGGEIYASNSSGIGNFGGIVKTAHATYIKADPIKQ